MRKLKTTFKHHKLWMYMKVILKLHYIIVFVGVIAQPLSSPNLNIYHHDLHNCITKQ